MPNARAFVDIMGYRKSSRKGTEHHGYEPAVQVVGGDIMRRKR
jgi:hypothetical protein